MPKTDCLADNRQGTQNSFEQCFAREQVAELQSEKLQLVQCNKEG
jgi:hypothetical protein